MPGAIFFVKRKKSCDSIFVFRIDFIPKNVIAAGRCDIDIF